MYIDLTTKTTPQLIQEAQSNEKKALVGHLGTHFDVMDKELPLEYLSHKAVVFDVRGVGRRDIELSDLPYNRLEKDLFVAFCSGLITEEGYGSKQYFQAHPQLSEELIDHLVRLDISLIGVDFAGVRRGKEHTPKDQYLADKGIFVIENLCNLEQVLAAGAESVKINSYPVNCSGVTGLPCRVVAEI